MKINHIAVSHCTLILGCILTFSAIVRLYGITFGLPALYDPDEPIFVLSGLHLLRDHTLNPGWFGHPGTTIIYVLGLIDALVYYAGHIMGQFPNPSAFGQAIYADPAIVVLPGRIFIALSGVICVLLTFMIGRRLFGARAGLIAAGMLALNPLHIQFSQIIRTDVPASVFMLLCVLCSINIVRQGRQFDYVTAGIVVGLACATKWPAATIVASPLGACFLRARTYPEEGKQLYKQIAIALLASIISLIVVSPYLMLDYQTLLTNLKGETRPHHLGATGDGFLSNLLWYLLQPLRNSVGVAGLMLAAAGMIMAGVRNRIALVTIIPSVVVFFVLICAQALIWARWLVPMLPFISLFIGVSICGLGTLAQTWMRRRPALFTEALVCCGIAIPMILTARSDAVERLHDTRSMASDWARRNIPRGSTIVLEHLAFDLLPERWRFLFPAGNAGCVDAVDALKGKIRYSVVDKWRNGRSVIDLGTINEIKLDTCWANYAIISHYDRYWAERSAYSREVAIYKNFLRGGTILVTFRPKVGEIGGPVVRIVKLNTPTYRPAK